MKIEEKIKKYIRRKKSVRNNVSGTTERPRVSVNRSNTHIYVQIINDDEQKTLVSASDITIKDKKLPKLEMAKTVGLTLGEKAKKEGIEKVVFDRSGYRYHGRVKALADGLREAGIKF